MENVSGLIGAITGVAGFLVSMLAVLVSVLVVRRQEKLLAVEQARNERSERLAFLSDRIFDTSIPRELRLPFYEEYISMKGNGTAVKFWLLEGQMEQKKVTDTNPSGG
ncbi:MAG: hypothetical protein LBI14_01590 [Treponema sp.]|jgi:hypothetical protein|nr:hypothetical protein [Treponema sp.]